MRPITVRNVTLLPEPDSPTTPRVSPGAIESVTPSTALTTPSSVGKWTLRFLTSRTGSATRAPLGRTGRRPSGRRHLRVPHTRIQERVDHVHDQVRDHDEHGREDGDAHNRRVVAVED